MIADSTTKSRKLDQGCSAIAARTVFGPTGFTKRPSEQRAPQTSHGALQEALSVLVVGVLPDDRCTEIFPVPGAN
jgi:hypothetical protein